MGHGVGDGRANIVVENSYVTVTDGAARLGDLEIRADGLFSLGYPRKDGGDEINTDRVTNRPVDGLRHAFELDEWPVTGKLSGEFSLNGRYEGPFGSGTMTIDDGVAYKEAFQRASASLRFDGSGVRLDGITMAKATGTMTGAAFVGWDGSYPSTLTAAVFLSSERRRSRIRTRSRPVHRFHAAGSDVRRPTLRRAVSHQRVLRRPGTRRSRDGDARLARRRDQRRGRRVVGSPGRHRGRPHCARRGSRRRN